jgi:hypothetical protein
VLIIEKIQMSLEIEVWHPFILQQDMGVMRYEIKMRKGDEKEIYDDHCFSLPYTKNGDTLVSNHPLMVINDCKEQNLLNHKVTKTLINCKWKTFGRFYYGVNFLFYLLFLSALTTYVYTSQIKDPKKYPNIFQCSDFFKDHQFSDRNISYIFPEDVLHRNTGPVNLCSWWLILILTTIRFFSIIVGHEKNVIWGWGKSIWILMLNFVKRVYFFWQNLYSDKKKQIKANKSKSIWTSFMKPFIKSFTMSFTSFKNGPYYVTLLSTSLL